MIDIGNNVSTPQQFAGLFFPLTVMIDQRAQLEAALRPRYDITGELGAGSMAVVYGAHDERHGRDVAIKVLRPEVARTLGSNRFLHEIRVTARLNHPNIVPLYASGEADGFLFYVMPVIAGETLRQRLQREKRLPVQDALSITAAIADALTYAHEHNVLHRDIKPENILLTDGTALIADFGIAAAIERVGGERLTATGITVGTPAYMSPEQTRRTRDITAASDVYSLATVVYEMLAGDRPFPGNNLQSVLRQILYEQPIRLQLLRRQVPAEVDAAVARALEKDASDRFETARGFADALSVEGVPNSAQPTTRPVETRAAGFENSRKSKGVRIAIGYVGAGALLVGTLDALTRVPDSVVRLVLGALVLGFPLTMWLSIRARRTAS